MSADGTKIESIYEPGWGETGPQKPEDQVMIENPISIYSLTEERTKDYQVALNKVGLDEYTPKELVLFTKSGTVPKQEQAEMAMAYAIKKLMTEGNSLYPKVHGRKDIPGGYSTFEASPVEVKNITEDFVHTNKKSGVKIPLENLLLIKRNGASEAEYIRGRNMIVTEANRALQIFNADFRIPQFPSAEEIKAI